MALVYATGEEIKQGDRITYDDLPGEIEFVADPESPTDETTAWLVSEFGGGVMVAEPTVYGRLFLEIPHLSRLDDHRLVFVSRKGT